MQNIFRFEGQEKFETSEWHFNELFQTVIISQEQPHNGDWYNKEVSRRSDNTYTINSSICYSISEPNLNNVTISDIIISNNTQVMKSGNMPKLETQYTASQQTTTPEKQAPDWEHIHNVAGINLFDIAKP